VEADETLVARAAAGSRPAFDELVRRHQGRVRTLARLMTGDEADADDLAQDAFVRAYRSIGRFRGECAFTTWLHRIAINVVKSHLARRGRRRVEGTDPGSSGDGRDDPIEAVAAAGDVEADLVRRQIIERALESLPGEWRLLVTLRDVQGLSYQEIAEVTGLRQGTVESGIFRARRRLRPLLSPLIHPAGWKAGTP
jgi:RNA polymerase sigma-70 factor, ECF subfamily